MNQIGSLVDANWLARILGVLLCLGSKPFLFVLTVKQRQPGSAHAIESSLINHLKDKAGDLSAAGTSSSKSLEVVRAVLDVGYGVMMEEELVRTVEDDGATCAIDREVIKVIEDAIKSDCRGGLDGLLPE